MSRAAQRFRQSDLVKALKALAKAGLSGRVEIATDGKIIIVASTAEQEQNSDILTPLDQWRAERGQG